MDSAPAPAPVDPHNLSRFVWAQDKHDSYATALAELRAGRKRTHWMWFVFPQLAGLGKTGNAKTFAITSQTEARAYLRHPVLGPRLAECADALLRLEGKSANSILGRPDDMKLRSCATLFSLVSEPGSVFHQVLDKYYDGQPDDVTLQLLGRAP